MLIEMTEIKTGGLSEWFLLGDSINKVYSFIQEFGNVFGLATFIIPEPSSGDGPIWLVMLESGLKLKFDSKYQKLCLIEIYLGKYSLEIQLKGYNLVKMGSFEFDKVQKIMKRPTYEP